MPTANRRRWMREYMKEYRQGKKRTDVSMGHLHHGNPAMRELLKEGHRLDSFKWRISKLLSSQYEILLYVEYAPEYGVFKNDDGLWLGYGEEFCNDKKEVMRCYPTLKEEFKHMCDIGGGELFKVFLLRKYSPKFDWAIDCIVGVLDKAALLENLQKLPCQEGSKWEKVLHEVSYESQRNAWRKLDFSMDCRLFLKRYTVGQLLKCTTRDHPNWDSKKLYEFLSKWVLGIRKIGWAEKYEWPGATDGYVRKLMISPLLGE